MSTKSAAETVLVVEAEFLVRWRCAEQLREAGFRVIEATCAGDAIVVFSSSARVDVVLAELDTPGDVNGHALARWLAKYHPDVRMLLTSRDKDATLLVASGLTRDFIAKPFVYPELILRLRQMLARVSAEAGAPGELRSNVSPAVPSDR